VDRKKQTSSGPRPGKTPGAPLAGLDDDAWDNLTGGDLVELGDPDPGGTPIDPDEMGLAPRPARSSRPGTRSTGPTSSSRGSSTESASSLADSLNDSMLRPTIPDLPAPVGPTPSRPAGKAASKQTLKDLTDLPAPVGKSASKKNVTDLPAPVGPIPRRAIPDLLAPVGARPSRPTAKTSGAPPVAAPPTATPIATPIATPPPISVPAATAMPDDLDLPMPVGPIPSRQLPDLLTPVGPTPSRSLDLPAPKGFFDDGVQPKSNRGPELPAPKGFFDDGVQPKSHPGLVRGGGLDFSLPLPLDDEPALAEEVPLDDSEVSFEDGEVRASDHAGALSLDLGDPLPGAVQRPFGLDAAELELERDEEPTPPPLPLELNDPLSGAGAPRSRTSRMELTLSASNPTGPGAATPDEIPSVVTFGRSTMPPPSQPRPRPPTASDDPFAPSRAAGHMLTTEIQIEVDPNQAPTRAPLPASVPPKRQVKTVEVDRRALRTPAQERRRMLLLLALLAVAVAGVGIYFGSSWWQERRVRDARAATGLRQAEKLLVDDSPSHWEQAASEARRTTVEDGENIEALALAAEASFAAALDESPAVAERIKEGDQVLATLRARNAKGPHATKAEALRAILSTNFDLAVKRLEEIKRPPIDSDRQLYLGWALAAAEQHTKAVAAFTAALARNKTRIPALYGLALSQLELGDRTAAGKSFQAVIDRSRDRFKRDHLGALIGLAQIAPVSDRASRYQELLARPDLATAPPRAVSRLRTLAGDEALRAGRFDQARARYQEARQLDALNLRAIVGLALLTARSGDLASARKQLTGDVLQAAPDHIEGALALFDVALAEKNRDEANALVEALFARKPPIANATLLGRAYQARARLAELTPEPAAQARAEADYREAMKRADDGDFAASIGLSALLMRLGRKQEALEVLDPIRSAAKEDPALALTLGSAYLAAGQAAAAEDAFRSVLARRADDAEARFQLGQALLARRKLAEAAESLRRAYDADPAREDIGLTLARTLEASQRSQDAVAVYRKMLTGEHAPSVAVRAQAGRTFTRLGMAAEADEQGEAIRSEDPNHSAGQFLLGEKLYREGNYDEALKAYREATRVDSGAQYSEGLGRASEKLAQHDDALRSYADAIAADPDYLAPRLGRGRVRHARREYALAVSELVAALKIAPDSAEVMRDLGRAYRAMHDVAHALPMLERAVALEERDAETHYELGGIYSEIDRSRQAIQHLSRAAELAAPNATWRGEAFRLLGYAQRAAGNRAGAIAAWRRYLSIEHTDGPERRDIQRMLLRLEAR
jgi:tetratricopeptide (TPR) repeat protein